jgi:hypothetical protein
MFRIVMEARTWLDQQYARAGPAAFEHAGNVGGPKGTVHRSSAIFLVPQIQSRSYSRSAHRGNSIGVNLLGLQASAPIRVMPVFNPLNIEVFFD